MLQEHASGTIPQERKGRTMTEDVNTVAELIVACLEAEGIENMFGMPDEENIRLVAATTGSTIRFILVHHEELAYRLGDDRHAWVQVIRGAMVLNGTSLTAGNGVAISSRYRAPDTYHRRGRTPAVHPA
jgi:hypothetical protein